MATNFVSNENATTLMTAVGDKIKGLGAYTYRGSITFANIPGTLTKAMTGYVYNITEDFTTDARFIEGAGKKYSAGTNIAVANTGTAESPVMKLDVNANFVNVAKLEALTADQFDATQAYAVGDVVIYEGVLYEFTSAHTADDPWDASEVSATNVAELLPEGLTTAQVNALISLLD